MPVPDTSTFSLQDVVDEIEPTTDDLVDCFADANASGFDPTYEGSKDRLSNFRNYTHGWEITTFSYSSNSFDVSNEDTSPLDIALSDDGTKMYILGADNDEVFQYTLSTAFDISTASYASKSLSVASEETFPNGMVFRPDGTRIYVIGTLTDEVYQYTLSTAWDISTASYDSKSFDVGTQNNTPVDVFFKPDGITMYVHGTDDGEIFQYTLSTAWDVSTASYDSKSFFNNSIDSSSHGLAFKSDGTRVYFSGIFNLKVYQSILSTAWDISTASFTATSLDVSNESSLPHGIHFKPDGTRLYLIDSSSREVYQYNN